MDDVAGRFDLPSTADINPGKVRTPQFMGQFLGCVHYSHATACGLFSDGVLKAEGEGLENAQKDILPSVWAGARLGAEIPAGSIVTLRPYVDFLAALIRNSLVETSTHYEFWRPPFQHGLRIFGRGNFLLTDSGMTGHLYMAAPWCENGQPVMTRG